MEKIKWGVLGCAGIAAEQTIPAMQQAENAELYGIASRGLEKAEAFQKRFGFAKAYDSYEALLDDPQVQAVYIPLPNSLHGEWVRKAAAKGKHVLCEKPLSGSAKDVEDIIRCCDEAGVVFMEAFVYLHSPIIQEIKKTVQSGAIGKVTMAEAAFFIVPPKPEDIRWKKETLGGGVYDVGCYPISLFLNLFEEAPEEIKAAAHFTGQGVDDFAGMYFGYADGKKLSISCGMCTSQRADRFYLYGTEGTLEAPIPYNAKGALHYSIVRGDVVTTKTMQVEDNYKLEIEQLGRCVLNGEKPWVSHRFSIENAKIIDRVLEAIGY